MRGVYFDGREATKREVEIAGTSDGIVLHAQNGDVIATWRRASLRLIDRDSSSLRLGCADEPDARVVVTDPDAVVRLGELFPRKSTRRGAALLLWVSAAVVVLLAVLVIAPRLARPVARLLPASFDRRLGDLVLPSLLGRDKLVQDPKALALLGRLAQQLDGEQRLRVALVDADLENALALPGGQVLLYCGLVRELKDGDELAGVLAHEASHVILRHSTEALVRVLGVGALLSGLGGDLSAAHASVAQLGQELLLLAHSRRAEAEADEQAAISLGRAGLRSGGLRRFFERLAAKPGSQLENKLAFLSTHPPPQARAAVSSDEAEGTPAFTDAEWRRIQEACR